MNWIERQRHFLDFTLSSLWRRKGKNFSVLLVYALVIFLVASVLFFSNALQQQARALLEDSPEMIVQRTIGGRHAPMPLAYEDMIRDIRGVRSVKARLWGYYFHPARSITYTIMAEDDFPYAPDQAVVGHGVLRTWNPGEGNVMYFKTYDGESLVLRVADTFDGRTELVSSDLILMTEAAFRKISGIQEGFATDLALAVPNQRECGVIAEKIVRMFPDARPILRQEIQRTYASVFDWRSGYVIVLLAGAVLAFFVLAWDKATGLSAEEKTEIGILKGVGWDTSDVLWMKFWEGTALSITAFVLGVFGAYLHVFLGSATIFEHALKGWSILYPSFVLTPTVSFYHLAVLLFLAVVPYTLITIFPCWQVAVADPDRVMKQGR